MGRGKSTKRYRVLISTAIEQRNVVVADEVSTVSAVEGDRLNIKCDYSEAKKIDKVQWTKEPDDSAPFDSAPIVSSKKSQWYNGRRDSVERYVLIRVLLPSLLGSI